MVSFYQYRQRLCAQKVTLKPAWCVLSDPIYVRIHGGQMLILEFSSGIVYLSVPFVFRNDKDSRSESVDVLIFNKCDQGNQSFNSGTIVRQLLSTAWAYKEVSEINP